MTETRLPAAIDAVVTALTAAGLTVWDGPVITGDYAVACVYVGYDGDPSYEEERASSTQQTWAGLGAKRRDETNEIVCAAVTITGNDAPSWKAARDSVYALVETVGQTLRADPSLGLSAPSVAELWPGDYFQEAGPAGYQARVVFSINHKTRV